MTELSPTARGNRPEFEVAVKPAADLLLQRWLRRTARRACVGRGCEPDVQEWSGPAVRLAAETQRRIKKALQSTESASMFSATWRAPS